MATVTSQDNFITNLFELMDNLGADGLDLDWEPLPSSDYANFTTLVQRLRGARPSMTLTLPIGWINANFSTPDPFFGTIAALLDRIDIMSYDMEWDADGWQSWFSSALRGESGTMPSSIDSSVAFWDGSTPATPANDLMRPVMVPRRPARVARFPSMAR